MQLEDLLISMTPAVVADDELALNETFAEAEATERLKARAAAFLQVRQTSQLQDPHKVDFMPDAAQRGGGKRARADRIAAEAKRNLAMVEKELQRTRDEVSQAKAETSSLEAALGAAGLE